MAGVRIRVESGPDEGLEVVLCNADVRIGRGAGADVPLADQGIMGSLRVWFDGTVYKATNEIDSTTGRPTDLRLENAEGAEFPFPARLATTWFAGYRIRLTDDTCLLLTTDATLALPDGQYTATRSRPPAEAKKQRDLITIVLIVLAFGIAAAILTLEGGDAPTAVKADGESGTQFRRLEGKLKQAREDLRDDRAARPVVAIHALLREARFAEVSARRAEAAERYVVAREELNRLLGPPDAPPATVAGSPELVAVLTEAREFVSARLVVLKDFIVRERLTR